MTMTMVDALRTELSIVNSSIMDAVENHRLQRDFGTQTELDDLLKIKTYLMARIGYLLNVPDFTESLAKRRVSAR